MTETNHDRELAEARDELMACAAKISELTDKVYVDYLPERLSARQVKEWIEEVLGAMGVDLAQRTLLEVQLTVLIAGIQRHENTVTSIRIGRTSMDETAVAQFVAKQMAKRMEREFGDRLPDDIRAWLENPEHGHPYVTFGSRWAELMQVLNAGLHVRWLCDNGHLNDELKLSPEALDLMRKHMLEGEIAFDPKLPSVEQLFSILMKR